jgi:hypothetical protein
MKLSTVVTCMLAVVLWVGAGALAQGQGKGQRGGDKGRDKQKEVKAESAKGNAQAGATARKDVGKGKTGQPADESAVAPGGPQGKKGGKAVTDAVEKGKGKGPGQQAQALQRQVRQEQAKHMERLARLNRIRELAQKKGDKDMIARVDKLLLKEQEVYNRKLQQVQSQRRAMTPQPETTLQPPATPPAPAGPGQSGKAAVRGAKEKAGGDEARPEPKKAPGGADEVKKESPAGREKPKTE